jgi:hypothetical protein
MKSFFFQLILLALSYFSSGQSCLQEGISFNSQQKIDNFQLNYPGCSCIKGNVTIIGGNVENLHGLNVLTKLSGHLTIEKTESLLNLEGLENLDSINGDLFIKQNAALINLNGLEKLKFLGGRLLVGANVVLKNLSGLDNLEKTGYWGIDISGNQQLQNLFGLGGLTTISSQFRVQSNPRLSSLDGIENLTSVTGAVIIKNNDSLTSLEGLDNLESIETSLTIEGNFLLTSLTGLEKLSVVGNEIQIIDNYSLSDIEALGSLSAVGKNIKIINNASVLNLNGLEEVTELGTLILSNNGNLEDISGLRNLKIIRNWFEISRINELNDLSGIDGLEYVYGIVLANNEALKGISALEHVDGNSVYSLYISGNPSLSECDVQSICDYLVHPNGDYIVENNDIGCNTPAEVLDKCKSGIDEGPNVPFRFSFQFENSKNNSNLVILSSSDQIISISILNLMGFKVHSIPKWQIVKGENYRSINLSNLSAGIYIVRIEGEKTLIVSKIIII